VGRTRYRVPPGLYAVGRPDADSPVLVSANYKLSFDHLRRELEGLDVWILVLDTRGVNVWCAAGKGTFGTEELVRRIEGVGLARLVRHRTLVVPQLGATGVAAHEVRRLSGFRVVWGPVRARDLPAFLAAGMKATPEQRTVTFTFLERLVLVPLELSQLLKPTLGVAIGAFVVSGIGPGIFDPAAGLQRGLLVLLGYLVAVLAGVVLVPLLLPWVPGHAFSFKGALAGAVAAAAALALSGSPRSWLGLAAIWLFSVGISSFLAMNFTGATPFTSPSGVEKEMRRALPLQALALLLSLGAWIGAAFVA
jgi:hypothetical protein